MALGVGINELPGAFYGVVLQRSNTTNQKD